MTILTIETAARNTETLADMVAQITRADVRGDEVRLFAGRRKVGTIALADIADPAPKATTVEGILAALDFSAPLSECEIRDRIEAALDEATRRHGSVVPDQYRYGYGVDQNCGDDLAVVLKAHCGGGLKDPMDLAKLEEVVDTNGIRDRFDTWMVKGLNNGMLRMNTGNVLRGKVRNGDPVRIGDRKWNDAPAA